MRDNGRRALRGQRFLRCQASTRIPGIPVAGSAPAAASRPRPEECVRYEPYDLGYAAYRPDRGAPPGPDAGRLWSSGLVIALFAGLIMILGVFVTRGVLGVPVPVGPRGDEETLILMYALGAAAVALQATALLHVLMATVARPLWIFAWTAGPIAILTALVPFALPGPLDARLATVAIDVVAAVAIVALLAAVSATAPPDRGLLDD